MTSSTQSFQSAITSRCVKERSSQFRMCSILWLWQRTALSATIGRISLRRSFRRERLLPIPIPRIPIKTLHKRPLPSLLLRLNCFLLSFFLFVHQLFTQKLHFEIHQLFFFTKPIFSNNLFLEYKILLPQNRLE